MAWLFIVAFIVSKKSAHLLLKEQEQLSKDNTLHYL